MREGLGNRRFHSIGIMSFSLKFVMMNRRVQGGFYLLRTATKHDEVTAVSHLDYGEIIRAKPVAHFFDIVLTNTESIGILLRRKPVMVERRQRVLLLFE